MAGSVAPNITTDGLVLFLDGANPKSVDTENLALNSESINLWGNNAGAVLVTPNAEIAPDGTQTADVLEQTNVNIPPSGASRWVSSINNITYFAGVTYTLSIWLKKVSGTDTQPAIYLWAQNGFQLDSFNMVGTITTEWRRYTRTFTPTSTVSSPFSGLNIAWNVFGVANNFKFAAWGFQIETGSSARDYVRTTSTPKLRTRWFDLSGKGNNAQLLNEPALSSSNSGSILFNGSNHYAQINSSSITNLTNNITLEFWYRSSSPQLWYSRYPSGGFGMHANAGAWKVTKYTVVDIFIGSPPTNLLWHHAVLIYSNNASIGTRIYVDGILSASSSNTQNLVAPSDGYVTIGFSEAGYMNGNIATVRMYNRVLSETEIQQNFKATKSRFGL